MEKRNSDLTADTTPEQQIVGNSPEIKALRRALKKVASIDSNVLIVGETGVGKQFTAKLIHRMSTRRNRPFVELNCSVLGNTVTMRELLGVESTRNQSENGFSGLIERANKGILFLSHIEDIPQDYQIELLNLLRDRQFRKIDGKEIIPIDVRVVASASTALTTQEGLKKIRTDLLNMLNTLTIQIPSLRERKQDIPEMFIHFLKKFCAEHQRDLPAVRTEIFESILEYDWRGNVRELENAVQNMILMSPPGELSMEYLPFQIRRHPLDQLEIKNLKSTIREVETHLITKALRKFAGNQVKAAKMLGIPEATLRFKMKKYRIPKE